MKATLYTHNEWFKLQMCRDRFESHLRIDSLKEVNTPLLLTAGATLNSNADTSTLGSSQVTICSSTKISEDGSSPTQASSRDVVCDENAILKVMVSFDDAYMSTFSICFIQDIQIFWLFGWCRSFLLCQGQTRSIFLHSIMEMPRWSFSKYLRSTYLGLRRIKAY